MSDEELIQAYAEGRISRRVFIRRLVAAGVSFGAAMSYAQLLAPAAAAQPIKQKEAFSPKSSGHGGNGGDGGDGGTGGAVHIGGPPPQTSNSGLPGPPGAPGTPGTSGKNKKKKAAKPAKAAERANRRPRRH